MPRKLLAFPVALLAALTLAGVALAGNGGIAPPTPHSPNAERISDAYYLILAITGGIFVLVEGALILFVFRFRSRGRGRTVEGPQIRGNTRIELIWTAVPVLILVGIVSFVLYKLPGIQDVPRARAAGDQLAITVDAHQFYWQFEYPDGTVSVDELRVPVNKVVRLRIVSHDVDHSWWIPEFSGKFDAIPGEVNHTWFKADKVGTYRGQCGEFCGVFHAAMNARVVASSQADFQRWISGRTAADLGREEWVGSCAKCHGLKGQGDYGPQIAANQILQQRDALSTLIQRGQGKMPPVAKGWSKAQLDALSDYMKKNIVKGAAGGVGAGGG